MTPDHMLRIHTVRNYVLDMLAIKHSGRFTFDNSTQGVVGGSYFIPRNVAVIDETDPHFEMTLAQEGDTYLRVSLKQRLPGDWPTQPMARSYEALSDHYTSVLTAISTHMHDAGFVLADAKGQDDRLRMRTQYTYRGDTPYRVVNLKFYPFDFQPPHYIVGILQEIK